MGSDESHFNVSVGSDGRSHRTVSANHNLFEEKGEPKRYRTEVLPLTSLTPYRSAKPAHVDIIGILIVSTVDIVIIVLATDICDTDDIFLSHLLI